MRVAAWPLCTDLGSGSWSTTSLNRFSPDGALLARYPLPVPAPTMCAFGGSRLDTLFVTSIRDDPREQSLSGGVFALNPGVVGLPEPTFTL